MEKSTQCVMGLEVCCEEFGRYLSQNGITCDLQSDVLTSVQKRELAAEFYASMCTRKKAVDKAVAEREEKRRAEKVSTGLFRKTGLSTSNSVKQDHDCDRDCDANLGHGPTLEQRQLLPPVTPRTKTVVSQVIPFNYSTDTSAVRCAGSKTSSEVSPNDKEEISVLTINVEKADMFHTIAAGTSPALSSDGTTSGKKKKDSGDDTRKLMEGDSNSNNKGEGNAMPGNSISSSEGNEGVVSERVITLNRSVESRSSSSSSSSSDNDDIVLVKESKADDASRKVFVDGEECMYPCCATEGEEGKNTVDKQISPICVLPDDGNSSCDDDDDDEGITVGAEEKEMPLILPNDGTGDSGSDSDDDDDDNVIVGISSSLAANKENTEDFSSSCILPDDGTGDSGSYSDDDDDDVTIVGTTNNLIGNKKEKQDSSPCILPDDDNSSNSSCNNSNNNFVNKSESKRGEGERLIARAATNATPSSSSPLPLLPPPTITPPTATVFAKTTTIPRNNPRKGGKAMQTNTLIRNTPCTDSSNNNNNNSNSNSSEDIIINTEGLSPISATIATPATVANTTTAVTTENAVKGPTGVSPPPVVLGENSNTNSTNNNNHCSGKGRGGIRILSQGTNDDDDDEIPTLDDTNRAFIKATRTPSIRYHHHHGGSGGAGRGDEDKLDAEDFQSKWMQGYSHLRDLNEWQRFEMYEEVGKIATDFAETAKIYGRVIISETNEQRKTLVEEGVGGAAGGSKFKAVKKTIYKCPTVNGTLGFRDYDHAAKVAGHDLKTASYFLSTSLQEKSRIIIPITTTVDFLGMRVLAMSYLPVAGRETLLFGSPDRMATVYSDATAKAELERITRRLNLRTHMYKGHEFPGAFDFEVHRSTIPGDTNMYGLDLSRMFPPEYIEPGDPYRVKLLYRLLRPELVQTNPEPLSSDAMSLQSPSPSDDAAVFRATQRLRGPGDDILPFRFADKLVRELDFATFSSELVVRLHEDGINVRYLGYVHGRLTAIAPESDWCCRVGVEIIARSFRKVMNTVLRDYVERRKTQDSQIKDAIVGHLNSLLATRKRHTDQITRNNTSVSNDDDNNNSGSSSSSSTGGQLYPTPSASQRALREEVILDSEDDIWEIIAEDTATRFEWRGEPWVPSRKDIFRREWTLGTFMSLISDFLGLSWFSDAWSAITRPEMYQTENPINTTFIREVYPRVKQMNIAHHARGMYLLSTYEKNKGPQYTLEGAVKNFELAIARQPSNPVTLRNIAKSLEKLWKLETGKPSPNKAYIALLEARIAHYLRQACAYSPDTNSLFFEGVFFDMIGKYAQAEALYHKSYEACKSHRNCIVLLGDILAFVVQPTPQRTKEALWLEAENYYRLAQSQDLDPEKRPWIRSYKATNNLAVLKLLQHKYYEAGKLFCTALRDAGSFSLWKIGPNCIAFARFILEDNQLVTDLKAHIETIKY